MLRLSTFPNDTILALFDTAFYLKSPLPPFSNGAVKAFVVQMTSLVPFEHQGRMTGRRILHSRFLTSWMLHEIAILQKLLPAPENNHYTATEICEYLGPNPKICSDIIPKTDDPISDFEDFLIPVPVHPKTLDQLLVQCSNDPAYWYDAQWFHTYFYAHRRPSVTRPLLDLSVMFSYYIPTDFLWERILKQLPNADTTWRLAISSYLQPNIVTAL
ncbi:hypothetical protein C8J56DRAFT_325251 [Mycena floridula]|nr:hypothetical protein C8J56DRAFT_325251 [Mycena floridula]